MINPLPDIRGGNGADDPWNDEDGTKDAPTGEIAVQSERGSQSQDKSEHGRRESPDECVGGEAPKHVAAKNQRIIVKADEGLVAQLKTRRRIEEGQIDGVID